MIVLAKNHSVEDVTKVVKAHEWYLDSFGKLVGIKIRKYNQYRTDITISTKKEAKK